MPHYLATVLNAIDADPNVSRKFSAALAGHAVHTTPIQDAINEAIARLTELRQSEIALERHLDDLDPAHLTALAALSKEAGFAGDGLLYQLAVSGGLATTPDTRREYRFIASDIIDDHLGADLRCRAEQLRGDDPGEDGNAEHRLSARDLGVGRP